MSGIGYAWIQTAVGAPDFLGNRRKRCAERVQAHVLDAIEQTVSRAMQGQPLDDEDDDQEEN